MLIRRNAAGAWLRATIAVLGLSMLAACGGGGGGGDDEPTVSRIEVTPAASSAPLGATQAFTATAILSDDTTRNVTDVVTWTSSNAGVASISNAADSKGRAETLGLGETTIGAAFEGLSGSTPFTVTAAVPVRLAITPASPSLAKGTSVNLAATATFSDDSVRPVTADASWSSSAINVVTVSDASGSKGRSTGVNEGSTTVRAVYQGVSGSVVVTVTPATVDSISVTPPTSSIPNGTSTQLTATAVRSDGTTQPASSAVWTSSSDAVATVDGSGKVTGRSVGEAVISVSSSGKTGSATVSVTAAVLAGLTIDPAMATVANGLTQTFKAIGRYSDDSTKDLTQDVVWTSADAAIASISSGTADAGKAVTHAPGAVKISAASGGFTAESSLTVTDAALTRIEVNPPTLTLPRGASRQFNATGLYTDNTTKDLSASATWSISDTSVADVSVSGGNRGTVLAKAIGSATVTASFGGQSGTAALAVSAATLSAIQVTPSNQKLARTFTRQYAATGVYSDGSTVDLTQSVSWSSSNTAFATVSDADDSRALVTGVAAGTADIVATQKDAAAGTTPIQGSTPVIVSSATLRSIAVTPSTASIPKGASRAFTATGTFTDDSTQDLTTQVDWNSFSSNATVSNAKGSQGVVTGVNVTSTGNPVEIRASKSVSTATSGSAEVTVTNATLSKITVTPNPATVAKGATVAFTATGTYSDGSTGDLTNDSNLTWTSSDTAKATIANRSAFGSGGGVARGVAEGVVTIKAATGSFTSEAQLTVNAAELASIAINNPSNTTSSSVAKGVSVQYAATGTYTDGSTRVITNEVSWISGTPAVATVSNADGSRGLASTHDVGSTQITASAPVAAGSETRRTSNALTLQVTAKTLATVTVSADASSIPAGTNQQYKATGTYSDGSEADLTRDGSLSWNSSTTTVATISNGADGNKGLASAVAPGTTTIAATFGSGGTAKSGSATLTVVAAPLTRIEITPATAQVAVGYFQQYLATGTFSDGSTKNITEEVNWDSFNDAIANVSNTAGSRGRATGVAAGTVRITAAKDGVSASVNLTVTTAKLRSIAVTPATSTIRSGETRQYAASGSFSDGSTLDLSRQVNWASSNTSVATIDQNGLATAGSAVFSSTNISATRAGTPAIKSNDASLTRLP
jgi:uncharacterized protein YjdB